MTLCISQTDPWQQIQQVTVYVKQGVELTNKADRGTDPSQLLTGEEVDRMDGPGTGCSNTQHSRPEIHNKKPTSHNNYKQTE